MTISLVIGAPRRSNGCLSSSWCKALVLGGTVAIAGCASSSSGSGGGMMDKALDLIGLQTKPSLPTMPDASSIDMQNLPSLPKQAKKVTLRIHAGEVLNTDAAGRPLSLVAKIYKLRTADSFMQLPYDAFKDDPSGKPATIEGVVEVREVVLTPGQKYEVVETLASEVNQVAIVGLFRAPDDKRWHFVFDAKDATKTGITMGAHGCAFSVSEGQPINAPAEVMRLAGVRCR